MALGPLGKILSGVAAVGGVLSASLPASVNFAHAAEPQIAATAPITEEMALQAVQKRRDMRHYSEDQNVQGIGVFINLRADSSVTGDQIGQWIQDQFGGINPPIPVEYRVNQSRGTSTDVTFYTRGFDKTLNIKDLETEMIDVLAHYRDVWLPETASLSPSPSPVRN